MLCSSIFFYVGIIFVCVCFFYCQRRAEIEGLLQSMPNAKEFARTV